MAEEKATQFSLKAKTKALTSLIDVRLFFIPCRLRRADARQQQVVEDWSSFPANDAKGRWD